MEKPSILGKRGAPRQVLKGFLLLPKRFTSTRSRPQQASLGIFIVIGVHSRLNHDWASKNERHIMACTINEVSRLPFTLFVGDHCLFYLLEFILERSPRGSLCKEPNRRTSIRRQWRYPCLKLNIPSFYPAASHIFFFKKNNSSLSLLEAIFNLFYLFRAMRHLKHRQLSIS